MNWWSRFSVTISKRMSLPTTLHECHTVKKPMDAYFYQCAHCGNSSPFIAALQQPIRLAIPVRQPAPVSSSRKETGAPTAAAAHLVQGFAAFPLVTIGVTNTEVTNNSDVDDGAADHGLDCTWLTVRHARSSQRCLHPAQDLAVLVSSASAASTRPPVSVFRRPDHEMPMLPVVRSRQSRVSGHPHRPQGP